MTDSDDLANNLAVKRLRAEIPQAVSRILNFRDEITLIVPAREIRTAAEFLQAAPDLRFDFLSDISAVDRLPLEPRFELNYHLLSIPNHQTLRLRVNLPGHLAEVETVTSIWPAANWLEREIFDLFGVRFLGHPDLRRILMPDDWEGYPLRKDYPVQGFR